MVSIPCLHGFDLTDNHVQETNFNTDNWLISYYKSLKLQAYGRILTNE